LVKWPTGERQSKVTSSVVEHVQRISVRGILAGLFLFLSVRKAGKSSLWNGSVSLQMICLSA